MSNHVAKGGFGGFLEAANLNIAQFGICCAFWFVAFVVTNYISAEAVVSFPPVALMLSGMSVFADFAPSIFAALGLLLMGYILFAYRASVVGGLKRILRKLTGRR